MEIEVKSREEKKLLGREEVELEVDHTGEPTPDRESLRRKVSAELDVDPEKVEVYGIHSSSGVQVSQAQVNVHEEPVMEELPDEEEEPADEEPEQEAAESEEDEGAGEKEGDEEDEETGDEGAGEEETEVKEGGSEDEEGGS